VEIERISINNQLHFVLNLSNTGSRVLRLARDFFYGASQVKGNSMNKSKIGHGDYVVFSRPKRVPLVPQNGDIVAAVVQSAGQREAVIKRFRATATDVILEPDSTDPTWVSQSYNPNNVEIIGKVVAILKKI
jgi:SOS-response transcriptional repressor LexA